MKQDQTGAFALRRDETFFFSLCKTIDRGWKPAKGPKMEGTYPPGQFHRLMHFWGILETLKGAFTPICEGRREAIERE